MKSPYALVIITFLFSLHNGALASANICPNLSGEFYCLINAGSSEPKLDVLTMKQWTDPAEPGVTFYSSDYRSIPGGGVVFKADANGIDDGFGWISKCKQNRVMSVTRDFTQLSELYIDHGDLVRADNQVEAQRCTPKSRR